MNAEDQRCFAKAQQRGDETFTLVGQDRSTPKTICFWIMENIETCPAPKLIQALHDAIRIRGLKNRKSAD